mmetsp:Transcript_3790/g.3534  ORF Transcript_3790/g.3534 Transcript_3790/m.3534 type:complete len:80 (+) Transcript_3790:223-462(+)
MHLGNHYEQGQNQPKGSKQSDKLEGDLAKSDEMERMTPEERKEAYRFIEEDFLKHQEIFKNIKEYDTDMGINLPLSSSG